MAEEGNLFLQQIPTIALPVVAKLIHLTVEKGPSGYRQRVTKTLTDHIYVTPQVDILKNYSGHAWRYEYQYVLPGSRMGCFHASELPVLFALNDIFGKADDPESIIVGDKMRRIWGSFAKTGCAGVTALAYSPMIALDKKPYARKHLCMRLFLRPCGWASFLFDTVGWL